MSKHTVLVVVVNGRINAHMSAAKMGTECTEVQVESVNQPPEAPNPRSFNDPVAVEKALKTIVS